MMKFLQRFLSGTNNETERKLLEAQVQVAQLEKELAEKSGFITVPSTPLSEPAPLQTDVVVFETADPLPEQTPVTPPVQSPVSIVGGHVNLTSMPTAKLTCMYCLHNDSYNWYLNEMGITYNQTRKHVTYHTTYSDWLSHLLTWHTEQVPWRLEDSGYASLDNANQNERTSWSNDEAQFAATLYTRLRAMPEFGWNIIGVLAARQGKNGTFATRTVHLTKDTFLNPRIRDNEQIVGIRWVPRLADVRIGYRDETQYFILEERESQTHMRSLAGVARDVGRSIPGVQKSLRGARIKKSQYDDIKTYDIRHGVCLIGATSDSFVQWQNKHPQFNEPLWTVNSRTLVTDEALEMIKNLRTQWKMPLWSNIGQLPLTAYGLPSLTPHYEDRSSEFKLNSNHPYWATYIQQIETLRKQMSPPTNDLPIESYKVVEPTPVVEPIVETIEEPVVKTTEEPALVIQTETGVNSIDGFQVLEEVEQMLPSSPRTTLLIKLLQAIVEVSKENSKTADDVVALQNDLKDAQEALEHSIDDANKTTLWMNEQTDKIAKSFNMSYDDFMEQIDGKRVTLPTANQQKAKDVADDISNMKVHLTKDKLDPDKPNSVH